MKKKFYYLVCAMCAAALSLCSCSNNEPELPTPPEKPEMNGTGPFYKEFDHEMKDYLFCTGVKTKVFNKDLPSGVDSEGYTWSQLDCNINCGGDYVYIGMKFEPWNPSRKNEYIRDIVMYAVKEGDKENEEINNPNWQKRLKNSTYKLNRDHASLNSGVSGRRFELYLIYTTDDHDGKYIVNKSFNGSADPGDRWPTANTGFDCARIVGVLDKNVDQTEIYHLGPNDNFMDLYEGDSYWGHADANHGHGSTWNRNCYRLFPILCRIPELKDWERDLGNWMKYVEDTRHINELSLAGSHDTWTDDIALPGLSRCQTLNVTDQFNLGARVFDMRVDSQLQIRHASAWTSYYADREMEKLNNLLVSHSTEFIFMNIQYESGISHEPTNEWKQRIDDLLKQKFGDRLLVYHDGLTLGEVRGKIMVFQNINPVDQKHLGGTAAQRVTGYPECGWSNFFTAGNDLTYRFYCQNDYSPGRQNYNKKVENIKNFYRSYEDGKLYERYIGVTYYSAAIADSSGNLNETAVTASHINPKILDYFRSFNHRVHAGYCHLDYYGTNYARQASNHAAHFVLGMGMAHEIMAQNFR